MILCSGCFDGLHAGHVAYLQGAKKLAPGEYLYCAVAPDDYIRSEKHREPRWSQVDRVQTLQAVSVVDLVLAQKEPTVSTLIDLLRPTAFVKGDDYSPLPDDDVVATCRRLRIPIWLVPGTRRTHTSEAMA